LQYQHRDPADTRNRSYFAAMQFKVFSPDLMARIEEWN